MKKSGELIPRLVQVRRYLIPIMSSRRYTIRQSLMAFGAALVIPGLVFAAVLLWRYASAERQRHEEQALRTARRIVAAVERELVAIQSAAQALATSSLLLREDLAGFQRQAELTLQTWSRQWTNNYAIVVVDAKGQQVVNTRLPWGSPLPRSSSLLVDQQVIATKQPVIQDLFMGATVGRLIISIRVPVLKEGAVTHVLVMGIESQRLAEILSDQSLPSAWIGTVIDRANRVVARSDQHDKFVGRSAPSDFVRAAREPTGLWNGRNLEGTAIVGAYSRSSMTGWTAFVGVPKDIVQSSLRQSLWTLFGLGAFLTLLSLSLARGFGQRIAVPVRGLVAQARQLGQGQPVASSPTGLVELDQVSSALTVASGELRKREAALKASEARLLATQNNAAVGIAEVDREGRFVSVNEARCNLTGHTAEELIGQHFGHVTDPELLKQDLDLFARQVAGEIDAYTTDSKFQRKDGRSGWARVTSTAVRDVDGSFLYAVRVIEDVTERRQADRRQRLLIDELNHRVKNTLATVQSLAWQASRSGVPPQVAQERFQERLLALSRTHNLLNETLWEGASLRTILETEFQPYATSPSRVRLIGPDMQLPARSAVVLGMAFHELATNAVKHGALSAAEGRVQVEWSVQGQADETTLTLDWCETDGPELTAQPVLGFGSRLLRQTITRELAGQLDIRFDPQGLSCTMIVPLVSSERQAA